MNSLSLETLYVPHLRGQFANGSIVLFLGAGFSIGARNRAGKLIPSVAQLTKDLWRFCFGKEPFDSTTQLQDIYETALSHGRKELRDLLLEAFTVDTESCAEWYTSLLQMPWLRIYTLNIDDLVFKLLSAHNNSRPARSVSGTASTDPMFDDSHLSIVHLNGSLDDVPDNIIFSRSQYARRRGRGDPAYIQLSNDLLFRPVVFIGSSLEEGPLWEHIELRGPKGRDQRELRPRSYLVAPSLNKSKQALLAKYNIVWLPMTGEEFHHTVLAPIQEERIAGHSVLSRFAMSGKASPQRFPKVADLASAKSSGTEEYLLGAEPTWADVTANRVAKRDCFQEIWELLTTIRSISTRKQVLVVTGTAGTGKSSALMVTAMRLEADGLSTVWLDSGAFFARHSFRDALASEVKLDALIINDADMYEGRLSSMIREAYDHNPRMVIICETRSSKVDRVLQGHELRDIEAIEYSIPLLRNNDIDAILDVLDREHRLGRLKGLPRDERRGIFQTLAGRQLLVAMHIATHGREFEEKVRDELNELAGYERFIYGLVCVTSAHRFSLRQEDVGIACGDEGTGWLKSLDTLQRRKLILPRGDGFFRARHRMIAQFAYDSLAQDGKLHEVVRAVIRIGATKTTRASPKDSTHARLLRTFINHNLMKHGIGVEQARQIYSDFEDALSWDHHFWLHRGALELETDNLDRSENFLNPAKSIQGNDIFVDNELAYLSFKKAIQRPTDSGSPKLIESAIATLIEVASHRPDQIAHAYHIMGQQGLIWAQVGIIERSRKKEFLELILKKARIAAQHEPSEMLKSLVNDIQAAILSLAVTSSAHCHATARVAS